MSIHFQKLTVADIRRETADCVSVSFVVPQDLKDTFHYKQGQYITLRTTINGEDVRRSYSICSSPLDNELRVAIKKVDGGIFSTYANEQLQKGDVLEVMPPLGKFFTELDPQQTKKIYWVCLRQRHHTFTFNYQNHSSHRIKKRIHLSLREPKPPLYHF